MTLTGTPLIRKESPQGFGVPVYFPGARPEVRRLYPRGVAVLQTSGGGAIPGDRQDGDQADGLPSRRRRTPSAGLDTRHPGAGFREFSGPGTFTGGRRGTVPQMMGLPAAQFNQENIMHDDNDDGKEAWWQTDEGTSAQDWFADADRLYEEARDRELDQKPSAYFEDHRFRAEEILSAMAQVESADDALRRIYRQPGTCDEIGGTMFVGWLMIGLGVLVGGYGLYQVLWHLVPVHPAAWLGLLLSVPVAVLASALTWHNFREWKEWKGGALVALCMWALAARCLVQVIGGQ